MLQIRKEQIDVLRQDRLREFEGRMMKYLRGKFAAAMEISETDLCQFVHDGLLRARNYAVISEKDARRFLECMITYGREFDSDAKTAWAGRILRQPKLTGTQKMNQIADYELFVLKGNT